MEKLEDICIDRDEVMISFDVKSLLTSVPVKEAFKVVEDVLNEDKQFEEQNNISRETLVEMLHVCLSATSFQFRGKHYELTDGLAMGSPVSPPVACIFMSRLEEHALATFQTRPSTWYRLVDDVFAIVKKTVVNDLANLNDQTAQSSSPWSQKKIGNFRSWMS